MTSVSIIMATTARPDRMHWTAALFERLKENNVDWELVVALDGGAPKTNLPIALRDSRQVKIIEIGKSVGAPSARNLALEECSGAWITSTDDDDIMPPGSLDARFDALQKYPSAQWAAGALSDLMPDGTIGKWDCPVKPGFHAPGDVWRSWEAPETEPPLGPTTLMAEANLLRACGGWQGLPQGEDLGMVCAVTSVAPGIMIDQEVYLYRKHPGQMTKEAGFMDLEQKVREITWRRGKLLSSRTSYA